MPSLNTASLPDLVFAVLFFFMIVTHMRRTDVKVRYRVPEGTEVSKNKAGSNTIYIYVGEMDGREAVQVGGQVVSTGGVAQGVERAIAEMPPQDKSGAVVSIMADRGAKMETILEIKRQLRLAGALRVNYSATWKAERKSKHQIP